jgi:hypothetical protein
MVLEPHYFRLKLNQWHELNGYPSKLEWDRIPPELHYFPALLFQVLAVSLQILSPGNKFGNSITVSYLETCDRLSEEYSTSGMEIAHLLEKRSSSVDAVQYSLLRCLYLKNCSRGAESWYNLGDAVRFESLFLFCSFRFPNLKQTSPRSWSAPPKLGSSSARGSSWDTKTFVVRRVPTTSLDHAIYVGWVGLTNVIHHTLLIFEVTCR